MDFAGWAFTLGLILLALLILYCVFIDRELKEEAKYKAILDKYKKDDLVDTIAKEEECVNISLPVSIKEDIKNNIDKICQWVQNGDLYQYVVKTTLFRRHFIEISGISPSDNEIRQIAKDDTVATVCVDRAIEAFASNTIQISSPVEGLAQINYIRKYASGDVLVTIDTNEDRIQIFNDTKRIELEARMNQPFFQWHSKENLLMLMANESLGLHYPNCYLKIVFNEGFKYNITHRAVYKGDVIGDVKIIDTKNSETRHTETLAFDDAYCISSSFNFMKQVETYTDRLPKIIANYSLHLIPSGLNVAEFAAKLEQERIDTIAKEKKEREDEEKSEIASRILARHKRRQLEKQVEMELIEAGEIFKDAKRPPIPQDVKDVVYNRDNGICVICGARDDLQFDHIIPFSKGGATSIENLQILCQKCNLEKSNHIG